MFVYLVAELIDYEGDSHLGMFSTYAKAKKFLGKKYPITQTKKPHIKDKDVTIWYFNNVGVNIEKWELDKA